MDEAAVAIVERELGSPPAAATRVEDGLLHETYEIRCDGAEYVLQFASNGDDDRVDSLERGLQCYVLLEDTGIPVPPVVTESVGRYDGRQYCLVEKLPGTSGERDISPERARRAARTLAAIHDASRFETAGWLRFEDGTPAVTPFEEGSLKRRILHVVAGNASVYRDHGLETVGNELERLFERRGEDLPEAFQPVLCHNDFSPDNVLFGGDTVTGVVDFDRAIAGHRQRDLAQAANSFWMHDPCADWDVREAFYEAYREVADPGSSFERNEPLYRVETLARTVAGMLKLDECSEYEREFYRERLLEAIDRVETD